MSQRSAARPAFFIWAGVSGLFLVGYAVYAGVQAAEHGHTAMWVGCGLLVLSALLTFTGAEIEWRRRARSRSADDGATRVEDRDEG